MTKTNKTQYRKQRKPKGQSTMDNLEKTNTTQYRKLKKTSNTNSTKDCE